MLALHADPMETSSPCSLLRLLWQVMQRLETVSVSEDCCAATTPSLKASASTERMHARWRLRPVMVDVPFPSPADLRPAYIESSVRSANASTLYLSPQETRQSASAVQEAPWKDKEMVQVFVRNRKRISSDFDIPGTADSRVRPRITGKPEVSRPGPPAQTGVRPDFRAADNPKTTLPLTRLPAQGRFLESIDGDC